MVTPRSPLLQGGVERAVLETATRLRRQGEEVEVLCGEPGGAPRLEVAPGSGLPIHIVRAWPARRDWTFAPGLWRAMARAEWDVVHVQSYHTFVAPLAMLRALTLRIPYCVTFHGGGHSSRLRNRLRGLQLRMLRPLLRRADRLIVLARFEMERYSRVLRLPRERFQHIANGTDLPALEPGAPVAEPDGVVLATIGRLERYKGHHRVIAALPHVLARRPEAKLLVVGTGPFEAELRRQTEALGMNGRVEFTSVPAGDGAAMSRLLSGVSLVVLMSEFETHPLVGLEAAAARRRLLVADRGGLLELADDGLAQVVALEAAPDVLGRAILDALDRPPPNASPRLSTWDDCAAELGRLYRELVNTPSLQ